LEVPKPVLDTTTNNFLLYTYNSHAKFNHLNDDFEEITTPYAEILKIMVDDGWSSYLVSEYENSTKKLLKDQDARWAFTGIP
jgi:hypothetical protein